MATDQPDEWATGQLSTEESARLAAVTGTPGS